MIGSGFLLFSTFLADGTWTGAVAQTTAGGFALDSLDAPVLLPMTAGYPFGNPLPAGREPLGWKTPVNESRPRMKTLPKGSVKGMAVNL